MSYDRFISYYIVYTSFLFFIELAILALIPIRLYASAGAPTDPDNFWNWRDTANNRPRIL